MLGNHIQFLYDNDLNCTLEFSTKLSIKVQDQFILGASMKKKVLISLWYFVLPDFSYFFLAEFFLWENTLVFTVWAPSFCKCKAQAQCAILACETPASSFLQEGRGLDGTHRYVRFEILFTIMPPLIEIFYKVDICFIVFCCRCAYFPAFYDASYLLCFFFFVLSVVL